MKIFFPWISRETNTKRTRNNISIQFMMGSSESRKKNFIRRPHKSQMEYFIHKQIILMENNILYFNYIERAMNFNISFWSDWRSHFVFGWRWSIMIF